MLPGFSRVEEQWRPSSAKVREDTENIDLNQCANPEKVPPCKSPGAAAGCGARQGCSSLMEIMKALLGNRREADTTDVPAGDAATRMPCPSVAASESYSVLVE